MRALLWLSFVLPSAFIANRLFGWPGVLAHALIAAVLLPWLLELPRRLSDRWVRALAIGTALAVVLTFAVAYPIFDIDEPGIGSDDDESHALGAWAILRGQSPYGQRTYLNNPIVALPGALLFAAPFALIGVVALQNLFWLAVCFLVLWKKTRNARLTLGLAWAVLALCLPVMHNVVTGSTHLSNAIYTSLGLLWLTGTRGSPIAAAGWGVALASRPNFIFLIPCAVGWLWREVAPTAALRSLVIICAAAAAVTLPFYLTNPDGFDPRFAAAKIRRYDDVIPYASMVVVAATALAAIVVGVRARTRHALFAGCAGVQAVAVLLPLAVSLASGDFGLFLVTYGEFATWYLVLAFALQPPRPRETSSTLLSRRWQDFARPGDGSASY